MSNSAHITVRYRTNVTVMAIRSGPLATRVNFKMSGQFREPFVVFHFCCNPTVQTDHGKFLSNLGYRVINSHNGFETIESSTSGRIDALVLELDRNQSDVLLIAREIERVGASLPTVVVVHGTQNLDGLSELATSLIPAESSCEGLMTSLEQILSRGDQHTELPLLGG